MSAGDRDRPEGDDGEAGGFLSRWSRRKAELRRQDQQPDAAPEETAQEPELEIDPATLPSIESLTEQSDFSIFLKKGVPPALRAAALRKLWLIEPSVVNYEPLVDYAWDFTAPGYGELLPTDDVAKMAQRVFSGFSQEPKTEDKPQTEAAPAPRDLPAPGDVAVAAMPQPEPASEPQPEPATEMPAPRRRHGGALPS
ncbi:MAG: DUF3306 domain-containing protein [Ferrovibrio sp.]